MVSAHIATSFADNALPHNKALSPIWTLARSVTSTEIRSIDISQKYIDNLLDTITKDLQDKRNTALNSLDTIVQSLSLEIEGRLSI